MLYFVNPIKNYAESEHVSHNPKTTKNKILNVTYTFHTNYYLHHNEMYLVETDNYRLQQQCTRIALISLLFFLPLSNTPCLLFREM